MSHAVAIIRSNRDIARLMWANDFPHSDSARPWSQDVLRRHAAHQSDARRKMILHDNLAALYGLEPASSLTA